MEQEINIEIFKDSRIEQKEDSAPLLSNVKGQEQYVMEKCAGLVAGGACSGR